jgi:hypothetical protein
VGITVVLLVLVAFLGACVAGIVFAVRRFGWKAVRLYLFLFILFRIFDHFVISEDNQAVQTVVPLVVAWVMVRFLLPHIMKQKALEEQEITHFSDTTQTSATEVDDTSGPQNPPSTPTNPSANPEEGGPLGSFEELLKLDPTQVKSIKVRSARDHA